LTTITIPNSAIPLEISCFSECLSLQNVSLKIQKETFCWNIFDHCPFNVM
jgi:hypothetical protein